MRVCAMAAAVGVALCVGAHAQPPPPASPSTGSPSLDRQNRADELALWYADKLADRARFTLGHLSGRENNAVVKWDRAVQQWKKDGRNRAEPLLAEGVLFECLSRMRGVVTPPVGDERWGVSNLAVLADQRRGRAAKAFERALKIDPALVEARLRAARIKSSHADAASELERIAGDGPLLFAYLAAVARAEAALEARDEAGATRWYQRALTLNPRSSAAAIGIAALAGTAVAFDGLDPSDVYYSYPCRVLTRDVDAELTARVARVVF